MKQRLIFIAMLFLATAFRFNIAQAQDWNQIIKACASDRETEDRFGYSVSISGDYAIVGAPWKDHDAIGGVYAGDAGSAYIFKNIAGTWQQVQQLVAFNREADDWFGCSVSISGDYAIVGAYGEDQDVSGGAYAEDAGSAYIFKNTAGTWQQVQKIVASDREAHDLFGTSVSISGDYVIVGAHEEDHDANDEAYASNAGSAYVFKNNAGTWQQVQKIVASDREAVDWFGYSVSISGDYAIVGAPNEDHEASGGAYAPSAGSAYIFMNTAGTWQQMQKIVASDREEFDYFGFSVSISGDYAIVGAYGEDHDVNGGAFAEWAGSAHIFKNNAGTWQQVQKIVASDREAHDLFGTSVSISGDYAIVGANNENHDASGGATATDAGSAYVFKNNAGTWHQVQKIVAYDRQAYDSFGTSVSISGDYAIVGADREDQDASGGAYAPNAGSAYIFKKNASSGISDASANRISIYPNPTNGKLTIESGQWTILNIEITDIIGKTMTNYQSSMKNSNLEIDLSGFERGIYLVRISADKEVFASKIVKE